MPIYEAVEVFGSIGVQGSFIGMLASYIGQREQKHQVANSESKTGPLVCFVYFTKCFVKELSTILHIFTFRMRKHKDL